MVDRGRRHARQDHHHQPGRRGAGSGAARSHRDQRRHHQRLRHQHAAGRRRLDGGGGRRKRRQLPAPARGDRRRHQHGPGAPGPLGHARGDDRRLRPVRRQHPVLRLRRAVHRPSGGAADDPAAVGPSHHHLRVLAAGRCARRTGDAGQAGLHLRGHRHRPRPQPAAPHGTVPPADAGQHNVQNALAAIAVGLEMEIDDATLRSAFLGFKGVKRRFTKTGEAGGITVIDDYGHHPGGDRRGAEGRAAGRRARRDRGGAAASLHAGCIRCSTSSAPA